MGCLYSKAITSIERNTTTTEKTYSWDNREKINPADFTLENIDGEEVGRIPGSINGQQFIVQNCKNSRIYLFDYINTITIDDCSNCTMFIGPTISSLFIRDCTDCVIIASCGQFRTRDCRKIDIYLHCQTQPIIEASTKMHFGCFQAYYPELEAQYNKAGMSIFNNNWSNIHDFTPVEGENNWSRINKNSSYNQQFLLPETENFKSVGLSIEETDSVVPFTRGSPAYGDEEAALVLFFYSDTINQLVKSFITSLKLQEVHHHIQHSREIKMEAADALRIFQSQSYKSIVTQGPVIALLFIGDGIHDVCTKLSEEINTSSSYPVSVCLSTENGSQQIDMFINFACMTMSI